MKKELITFILFLLQGTCSSVMAQVPFVHYEPVPSYQVNSEGKVVPLETTNQFRNNNGVSIKDRFSTIGGYTIISSGQLKRVKIKVNPSSSLGMESIYLRAVYNSYTNMWFNCNTQATKVDAYSDTEFIVNNFEWKVESPNSGIIYFNF